MLFNNKNETLFYQFKSKSAVVIDRIIILTTFPEAYPNIAIFRSKFRFEVETWVLKQSSNKIKNYHTNKRFCIRDQKCCPN